jgi:hypothetical protein
MKPAISFLCCLAILSLSVSNLKSAADRKPLTVQLLEVGEFHGDEVRAKRGEGWLGLFLINSEHILLPTTITVEDVRDDLVNGENEMTGKNVSIIQDQAPLFLIKGLHLQAHKSVPTVFSEKKLLYDAPLTRFNFGGRDYEISASFHKEEDAKKGVTLAISSGSETQTLRFIPDATEVPENMSLIWAGDLDMDGKLDLYLDISDHYNVSQRALFLSSQAGKGKMVRKVAEFKTVGC